MDNIVTITNSKENTLVFDMSIQGLTTEDIRAWFNLKTEGVTLTFECKKLEGDKWEVTIPAIPYITKTAYPCTVTMVADGYFFEPMTGSCNVVGTADVYVTTPKVELQPAKPAVADTPEERHIRDALAAGVRNNKALKDAMADDTPAPTANPPTVGRKFSFATPTLDKKQEDEDAKHPIDRIMDAMATAGRKEVKEVKEVKETTVAPPKAPSSDDIMATVRAAKGESKDAVVEDTVAKALAAVDKAPVVETKKPAEQKAVVAAPKHGPLIARADKIDNILAENAAKTAQAKKKTAPFRKVEKTTPSLKDTTTDLIESAGSTVSEPALPVVSEKDQKVAAILEGKDKQPASDKKKKLFRKA